MASNAKDEMVLMAVGDVFVNRADPPSVFAKVESVLRQGDFVMCNLEGLNCDAGTPIDGKIEAGSRHLRSTPDNMRALTSAGFNAVGMANNHNMDYGPDGLMQCVGLLDKANIAHTGGGRNLVEAHKPAIIERNGTKVALLAYTSVYIPGYTAEDNRPGLSTLRVNTSYQAPDNAYYQPGYPPLVSTVPDAMDQERMMNDVREARKQADIVVAGFHWGVSWGYGKVVGYQKELGRAAIDAGADLILGCHPHSLQAMEFYKGKLICYCMGNFVMDGMTNDHFGADTIILKCMIKNKKITKCSFIPVRISEQWQPYIVDRVIGLEVMKKMDSISTDFGTTYSMENGEVVVGGPKPGTPEARRGFSIEPHRGLPVLVDALLPLPYIMKKVKAGFFKKA